MEEFRQRKSSTFINAEKTLNGDGWSISLIFPKDNFKKSEIKVNCNFYKSRPAKISEEMACQFQLVLVAYIM